MKFVVKNNSTGKYLKSIDAIGHSIEYTESLDEALTASNKYSASRTADGVSLAFNQSHSVEVK